MSEQPCWWKTDVDQSNWFELILLAESKRHRMETAFEERWTHFCYFSWDTYDNSIELYFSPETPEAWKLSQEDWEFLKTYGASFGWANFTDGTEICFNGGPGERKAVQHPRWTRDFWNEWWNGSGREASKRERVCAKCGTDLLPKPTESVETL